MTGPCRMCKQARQARLLKYRTLWGSGSAAEHLRMPMHHLHGTPSCCQAQSHHTIAARMLIATSIYRMRQPNSC